MNEFVGSVKDRLLDAIDARDYYSKVFPDWNRIDNSLVVCPRSKTHHEDGDDSTPSFSINGTTGEFNCFGCSFHGTQVIGFHTDIFCEGNFNQALATLYRKYVGEVISNADIRAYHRALLKNKAILRKLLTQRGWTKETIKLFRLGWNLDTKRLTIPIYTPAGFAVNLLEHDSLNQAEWVDGKRRKMLHMSGAPGNSWYPFRSDLNPLAFENKEIWLVEGEPDCISARQDGLNAITLTGGSGSFTKCPDSTLVWLRDRDIILCFDSDKAGKEAGRKLTERLVGVGVASLKSINVPEGKDIGEYFTEANGTGETLRKVATLAPHIIKPRGRAAHNIPLAQASNAKYVGEIVYTNVLVNGKHRSPFIIPRKLKYTCSSDEACPQCPSKQGSPVGEYWVDTMDPTVLEWLKNTPERQLKAELGIAVKCPVKIVVTEYQNLEQLSLIPALSASSAANEDQYCQSVGFYAGHGIDSNTIYRMEVTPTLFPKTKESCLIIHKAKGTTDSIENFTLTPKEVTDLKEIFCDEPKKILRDVAEALSYNATKIYRRWELHTVVDLCFHSLQRLSFAGCSIPKSTLEALILGDTRCGKGQVADGIRKYLDLGEIISGENCSFMGLVGGASKLGDSFQLVWGAIPINNGRLVIVDEFSGLSNTDIGRLSRIRSEGIAEINKGGIAARTAARTRLIWIGNPRNGRVVSSFPTGVEIIRDLIPAAEDMARYDIAIIVKSGEVPVEEINKTYSEISTKYTRDTLRRIALWVWSRKEEHVIFTREAISYTLQVSNLLAKEYSATIPLIQGENIRYKIAKLSAAVAGRCFSTEDGTFLRVAQIHVETAVAFLRRVYNSETTGYRDFSIKEREDEAMNFDVVAALFKKFEDNDIDALVNGLLGRYKLSVNDIEDWCSKYDRQMAKAFAGILVREKCLEPAGRGEYKKRKVFTSWLKGLNNG